MRPNIYRAFPFYAPAVLTADRAFVKVGFPYPPLQLLLALTAHLVAGDYRYIQTVALSASGLLVPLPPPTPLPPPPARLLTLPPRLFWVRRGLLHAVRLFEAGLPFGFDSLSLMALGWVRGLFVLPPWRCFAFLGALLLAGGFLAERSARGFAAACAFAFGVFFFTAKQS